MLEIKDGFATYGSMWYKWKLYIFLQDDIVQKFIDAQRKLIFRNFNSIKVLPILFYTLKTKYRKTISKIGN